MTTNAGSTLADPGVIQCVTRAVAMLSFPSPATGTVTVNFPITFSPNS